MLTVVYGKENTTDEFIQVILRLTFSFDHEQKQEKASSGGGGGGGADEYIV
jgi:hypothetical protein